jgi:rhodanese-related sulfurtransferase
MQLGEAHPGTFNGSPRIDAELLAQELRAGRNIVVVDVRNKDEFVEGHIHDARSIPIHQLVARACEITTDRSVMIIVVSGSGDRAKIAAASLRLAGYPEVAILAGGMRRWRELDLPVRCTSGVMRAVSPIQKR